MDAEVLFSSNAEDIKRGYIEEKDYYRCLLCGETTEKGVIYQVGDLLFDAEKKLKVHIESKHGSVFEFLLGMGKRYTGLSDHQKQLLQLFYEGRTDTEIQKMMGIGSGSTIRNHRFLLKERERQAKIFLILMDILKSLDAKSARTNAKNQEAETGFPRAEETEILKKFFPDGLNGPLSTFQIKEKYKIVVLKHLAGRFRTDAIYTEKEVNEILQNAHEDFVTLRRYLIEYGFMERKPDGRQYWIKNNEEKLMDHRKELVQKYKEIKKPAGVYQIRNIRSGKVWIKSASDLKTMNGKRFELIMGSHKCTELQKDWNELGEEAFAFEVLEVLKEDENMSQIAKKDALKKLEEQWIQKLQPFGEKGYNG